MIGKTNRSGINKKGKNNDERKSKKLSSCDILFAGSEETNEEIGKCVAFLEEEEEVDLKAVAGRIAELEKELMEVQGQMANYLKELGLN